MEKNLLLGLDISTSCIGVSLFCINEDNSLDLKLLHHVSPKADKKLSKTEQLFIKADIFRSQFLHKYSDLLKDVKSVIIEEPLLVSNNIFTIATLLKFNGIISHEIYRELGIVPEFISSRDSRMYAFPELMSIRKVNKKGEPYPQKKLDNAFPVLFGDYPWEADKKKIIWEKINEYFHKDVHWIYNKKNELIKENYDMSDAACCVLGWVNKNLKGIIV